MGDSSNDDFLNEEYISDSESKEDNDNGNIIMWGGSPIPDVVLSGRPKNAFNYLRLKSGVQFFFNDTDGNTLLLNERLEPYRLIRNIISTIPAQITDRFEFLSRFDSDEDSDETQEHSNGKRYIGTLIEHVYESYIKEYRLRYVFKRVIVLWRIYKMNKLCSREPDPITLMLPEKEVYVYDWANRKKFVFDARGLANLIESKLKYHEYGFPIPLFAKNPSNNIEFTYKQYVSIYKQLKDYGELRWGLTTLKEHNFNKNKWQLYHKSALTINAIRNNLKLLESMEARELLLDFILSKMEELNIRVTQYMTKVYEIAMIRLPTHWYLEGLKSLAIANYETEHFGHYRTRTINAAFIKIIKKQSRFVKDLQDRKII